MHPDMPELLDHLQALERMTGVPVGQQCVEMLRYVEWKHPLRQDLIDLATGFSTVGIEFRAEVRTDPLRVNLYPPGQGPD